MSIKSWAKEFYSVPADKGSQDGAVARALVKWRGLSKKNITKHKLHKEDMYLIDEDGNKMKINFSTCALCNFWRQKGPEGCKGCPLETPQGTKHGKEGCYVPYNEYRYNGRVGPMVKRLSNILKKKISTGPRPIDAHTITRRDRSNE